MSTITSQQQILEELISTEENYVRDLKDICEVYLPCYGILQNVTKEDTSIVFSNIESILTLSRKLLDDLKSANGCLIKTAESFLNRASDFHQYTTYCTCYHRANERLFEMRQKIPLVATILLDVQKSLGHALPLSSYLHKPVQRIMKYHLILKNLLKFVPDADDSKSYLREAHEMMANCAEQINNSKRLTDMDVKTRELHELLLTLRENSHFGKLIREGEMLVDIGKSSSTRSNMFIYLFENFLVLCHKRNESFALHSILRCPELVLIEDGGKKMTEFVVMTYGTPSQTFTIHAKTLAQKLDWCIQLRKLTNHIVPNKAQRLLVSATNEAETDQHKSFSKLNRRRSNAQAVSPTNAGSSMRTRLRGSISGLLTKSQSVINLRRSSSSISGGSSLYKNYDSALDSASLKSDASGSSDQLSSLSSAAGSNLTSPQYCQNDPASDAVCLRHESPRDQPSNHYHKLSAQVSSLSSSRDFRTKVRKSQSCEVLTTSDIHDREDNSKNCSPSVQDQAFSIRAEAPWIKRNLLDTKKHFLQKLSRLKRRGNKNQNHDSHPSSELPEFISNSSDLHSTGSDLHSTGSDISSCESQLRTHTDTTSSDYESSDEATSFKETLQEDSFDLNIADNFSESLLETFNSVLQVQGA